MSDTRIFKINGNSARELKGSSIALEKSLQNYIEQNLETLLGIKFLASEYSTGKTHQGRIDTLGIDENNSPVIIEYKRALNENVINQGLFYMDWLLDHKAEFKLKVMETIEPKLAKDIEWSSPRLICIAGDFTKYDAHAIQQINSNIELIRYQKYEEDLLLLDLVGATIVQDASTSKPIPYKETEKKTNSKKKSTVKTITKYIKQSDKQVQDRYEAVKSFIEALGDDVQCKILKHYVAFKRIKTFACLEVHPQNKKILIYVKVDPAQINIESGFTRDMRNIGHYGTGDLEITIKSYEDLEKAKYLIQQSYDAN
jgi:predicted transport protein